MIKLKGLLDQAQQVEDDYRRNKRRLKEEMEKHVTGLEIASKEFIDFYYWETGLPLEWIEKQAGVGAHNIKQMVKEREISIPCGTCGNEVLIIVRSRTEMQENHSKLVCTECTRKGNEWRERERKRKAETYKKAVNRTVVNLKTMPYASYLQTPHWLITKKQALERARYTCQKCGIKNVKLFVHHLTYERRGCELPSDLMALCESCHKGIHGIILQQKEIPRTVPKPARKKREAVVKKPTKKRLKTKKWSKL